jgi:hypothetical protein
MVRRYPQCCEDVIPSLNKAVALAKDPESKVGPAFSAAGCPCLTRGQCALIWIMGEFGATIPAAPYLLETYIDKFDQEKSAAVRLDVRPPLESSFAARI